jgi:predicted CoA-binding protein
MNTTETLQHSHTVLLVDWPSRDVPESLVEAGFVVYVKGGPNPDDFFLQQWRDNQLVQQRVGHPPAHADLVFSYRPLSELPGIIDLAKSVHAKTIWTQSGLCSDGKTNDPRGCWLSHEDKLAACRLIQSAGLQHISQPYIADVARQLSPAHS